MTFYSVSTALTYARSINTEMDQNSFQRQHSPMRSEQRVRSIPEASMAQNNGLLEPRSNADVLQRSLCRAVGHGALM